MQQNSKKSKYGRKCLLYWFQTTGGRNGPKYGRSGSQGPRCRLTVACTSVDSYIEASAWEAIAQLLKLQPRKTAKWICRPGLSFSQIWNIVSSCKSGRTYLFDSVSSSSSSSSSISVETVGLLNESAVDLLTDVDTPWPWPWRFLPLNARLGGRPKC